MKKQIVTGAVLLLPLIAAAADIKPLAVKPGLWEVTVTSKVQLPDALLSQMSPDRRAQMEANMAARSGQASGPKVVKVCLDKDSLSRALNLGADTRQNCRRKLFSSSPTRQEVDVECTQENGKFSGRMTIETLSPDAFKGSMQMTREGGMGMMKINVSATTKYLGPDCGDVKPR